MVRTNVLINVTEMLSWGCKIRIKASHFKLKCDALDKFYHKSHGKPKKNQEKWYNQETRKIENFNLYNQEIKPWACGGFLIFNLL